MNDAFTEFEHEGWERVADKYDSTWSISTRQFIPPLFDAAQVSAGMSILDVGCGPGYVSTAAAERGAKPIGLDFSKEMIAIAKKMFPNIEFREGDWKASGIRARDLTTREPFFVLGSQGQLEQVFLNLLVHAEQSLAEAPHFGRRIDLADPQTRRKVRLHHLGAKRREPIRSTR